jgi:hypothetical protein
MTKTTRFRVRQDVLHDFPTDMLRHDACWPETSDDAVKLATACRSGKEFKEIWGGESIGLVGVRGGPTPGRWASFGWEVVRP